MKIAREKRFFEKTQATCINNTAVEAHDSFKQFANGEGSTGFWIDEDRRIRRNCVEGHAAHLGALQKVVRNEIELCSQSL